MLRCGNKDSSKLGTEEVIIKPIELIRLKSENNVGKDSIETVEPKDGPEEINP